MKKSFKILGFLGVATILAACGNQVQPVDPRFLPSQGNGTSTTNSSLPGYMQCSEQPNILNSGGDRSKEYRACAVSGNQGSVTIYPAMQSASNICVFPARNSVPLVYNNQWVAQCGPLSASGTVMSFQGVVYDSIYIVPSNQGSIFSSCLGTGNPYACSSQYGFTYSFGRI
jgi:hypothetical protein